MLEFVVSFALSLFNFMVSFIFIKISQNKGKENFHRMYFLLSGVKLAILLVISIFITNYLNISNLKFFGFFLLFYFIFQFLEILFLIKTNNS